VMKTVCIMGDVVLRVLEPSGVLSTSLTVPPLPPSDTKRKRKKAAGSAGSTASKARAKPAAAKITAPAAASTVRPASSVKTPTPQTKSYGGRVVLWACACLY